MHECIFKVLGGDVLAIPMEWEKPLVQDKQDEMKRAAKKCLVI